MSLIVSLSSTVNNGDLAPSTGFFVSPGSSHINGFAMIFPDMLLSTPIYLLISVFTIPGYAALTNIPLPNQD